MKSNIKFSILALLLPLFALNSCIKSEGEPNKHQIVADYLKANNMDLPAMHSTGWAVTAATLNTNLTSYYVIDLRSAADFALGRIQGAVNSTLANVVTAAKAAPSGKTVILVCYSGQNSAYAIPALRMSGIPTAVFLKWGMSAWTSERDVWTAKIGNIATSPAHTNWITPPAFTANSTFTIPTLNHSSDDPATILKDRIALVLSEGAKFMQPANVLDGPATLFINNYWTAANVTANGNGHIRGAYRINPLTLTANEFANLNPAKQIVTYCWTGQTSAAVTFYLRVLGYDAYGLQWGANALCNSLLGSNKWPEGQQNLPLVTQ